MTNKEFAAFIKPYNKQYYELFDYIPKITDFSCNQQEYIAALKESVDKKIKIEDLIV
ncbi:MAG: hypothetical protein LUG12_10525 [Erysipelotrichaceae bacterium]|nr:hypothetical protein [Erysipelotrichaceae bacterium]